MVEGDGPSSIGQSWLTEPRLDWKVVCIMNLSQSLEGMLELNKEQVLGKIKNIEAKLHVDTQTKLLYFKARFPMAESGTRTREVRESRCNHTCAIFRVGYTYSSCILMVPLCVYGDYTNNVS